VIGSADELRDFAARLLAAAGAPPGAAALTAARLVDADSRGHGSHGVRLVPGYARRLRDGRLDGAATPEIVRDDGATVVVDANRSLGQTASSWLAALAAERAQRHGVAALGVRRCGHLGRLHDLAALVADRGPVCLVFANDAGRNAIVAPYGGTEPRLATNPIAVGIPRRSEPHLVLDMATSATSHGGLAVSRAEGRPDGPGWAHGEVLLPAAGAKGFGLGLVADVLGGALTGAGHAGDPAEVDYQGILLVTIDVARFAPRGQFADRVEQVVGEVKRGNPSVRVPGEAGAAAAEAADGRIQVPRSTWARLVSLAEESGISIPPIEEEQ